MGIYDPRSAGEECFTQLYLVKELHCVSRPGYPVKEEVFHACACRERGSKVAQSLAVGANAPSSL